MAAIYPHVASIYSTPAHKRVGVHFFFYKEEENKKTLELHASYKITMWFINNAQRMLELVNTIVDSAADIVAHNLAGASAKVENAMAKVVPIAIGFLAGVIGIGNLSKKVGDIIDRVKVPITKAIDWVVDKAEHYAKKFLNKILGKDKPKEDKRTPEEKQRDLDEGVKAGTQYLKSGTHDKKETDKRFEELKNSYQLKELTVVTDKQEEGGKTTVHVHGEVNPEKDGEKVQITTQEVVESSKPQYGTANPFGSYMYVDVLAKGHDEGTEPSAKHEIYNNLNNRRTKEGNAYYVRGHLLNHNIGGPGNTWQNLTPLKEQTNKDHLNEVEREAKSLVGKGEIIRYKIQVIYGNAKRTTENEALKPIIENEHFVPTKLVANLWTLKKNANGNGWEEPRALPKKDIINDIGKSEDSYYLDRNTTPKPKDVYLSNKKVRDIRSITIVGSDGISTPLISINLANSIVKAYENMTNTQFHSFKSLADSIPSISAENRSIIESLGKGGLNYVKLQ